MHDKASELAAGVATATGWTLWGLSLTGLNELLQTVTLLTAIACSIAGTVYYRSRTAKRDDDR